MLGSLHALNLSPLALVFQASCSERERPAFWSHIRQGQPVGYQRLFAAVKLAAGTGFLLAGLDILPKFIGILLAVLGVVLAIFPLRFLLIPEKLQVQFGFPLALVARGLFTATYFGTESFLVLALTSLKGYRADTAGLVVVSAALTWFGGTWVANSVGTA